MPALLIGVAPEYLVESKIRVSTLSFEAEEIVAVASVDFDDVSADDR